MLDIVVSERVHELARGRSGLRKQLSKRFSEAVHGAAFRHTGALCSVGHPARQRLFRKRFAVSSHQDVIALSLQRVDDLAEHGRDGEY